MNKMEQKGYSMKQLMGAIEKERLWFAKNLMDDCYEVYNQSNDELIGRIRKERTGQWMHWCFVIDKDIMQEMINSDSYLMYSPGCQDEIRQFCKELGGKNKKSSSMSSKENSK